eukprot:6096179-Amphidinium_carterae.2
MLCPQLASSRCSIELKREMIIAMQSTASIPSKEVITVCRLHIARFTVVGSCQGDAQGYIWSEDT